MYEAGIVADQFEYRGIFLEDFPKSEHFIELVGSTSLIFIALLHSVSMEHSTETRPGVIFILCLVLGVCHLHQGISEMPIA